MLTSRTTTTTSTTVGSISVTGRHPTPPLAPTRPLTPDPSDEERQLELQLEHGRQRQEAAERAANARKLEEEAAEKRRRMAAAAAARNHWGPSPGAASTSARRVEVEVPRVVKKGKGKQRMEVSSGDPDDGGDGEDDDDEDDEERTPCERCQQKKIPCLEQPVQMKREGGGQLIGERLAVLESQMAQLLADNRQLREAQLKDNNYNRHINRKLDWLMMDAARRRNSPPEMPEPGPSRLPTKRRRVVDSEEEEEDRRVGEDEEGEEEVEEEEGGEPAPKRARSEKGKEREE
ncbi:hypothetical protein F5879DRAFT_995912 [Lentinula edodes]|nr:hypothetical protein F5879DRAFT_995912 [Lentinula edodes]